MKRKTNKTKEEAWSQTAHAPDGEQPGPEASDTSGQSAALIIRLDKVSSLSNLYFFALFGAKGGEKPWD